VGGFNQRLIPKGLKKSTEKGPGGGWDPFMGITKARGSEGGDMR